MGTHLVLFRDVQGHAVALEDRCRHRNIPLSQGKVINGKIECPYHGWCYHADGNIAEIPANAHLSERVYPVGISSFHCVEQDDYVWVCLSNQPANPKPVPFPNYAESGWVSFHMKTRFNASVDACLENFLDCPHATYVHRGWFRSPTKKKVEATVRTLEDGAEVEYFEEPRVKSAVWSLLSSKKASMKHTDRFIAPATSTVDYVFSNNVHYKITSSCTPIEKNITEVYTVVTFKVKWFSHLVRLYFQPLSKLIIRQDVNILQAQADNVKKFSGEQFSVIETDVLYKLIKQWRLAMHSNHEPPIAGEERKIEISL